MPPARRYHIIQLCFLFVGLLFLGRLFQLQIVRGEKYANFVLEQSGNSVSIQESRGNIFFQTKHGTTTPAALTEYGYTVSINPQIIIDPDDFYLQISQFLDLDKDEFIARASKENDPYEIIARQVPYNYGQILKEKFGYQIGLQSTSWRTYPYGSLAAQTLGFTGQTASDQKTRGRYGIERSFNDALVFSRQDYQSSLSFLGTSMYSLPTQSKDHHVTLTIEPNAQRRAEEILSDSIQKTQSVSGGVVILNPQSGKLLAMAALPSFDPNDRSEVFDQSRFQQPLVENVYEFGSIIKPFIATTALDSGAITSDYTYLDKGSIEVEQETIWNYDKVGRGQVGLLEVLGQSLNTGMVDIIQRTPRQAIKQSFTRAGALEKTDIDLPNEANNITRTLTDTSELDYASLSFGQAFAMTPLSAARTLAVLANNGKRVDPYLISDKTTEQLDIEVFDKASVTTVTNILVEATKKNYADRFPGANYTSYATKTGTAQIADLQKGGYSDGRLHSFIGYFPARNPEFFVLLYLVEPKGYRYASETLAIPFFELATFLNSYYEL